MMSNSCTPMGNPSPLKKNGAGRIFWPPSGRGTFQTFPSNRPWKGVSKTGFKIFGAPLNKFAGGGSKLVPNFVILRLFRPFLHNVARISPFTNLKTDYQTTDTSIRYGEKMVYFGPPWNTWLWLMCTHPVGGGIPTRWSNVKLMF